MVQPFQNPVRESAKAEHLTEPEFSWLEFNSPSGQDLQADLEAAERFWRHLQAGKPLKDFVDRKP